MLPLIVASTLISVAEAFYKMATPAATPNFEAHDAVIDGFHIALPPSMKTIRRSQHEDPDAAKRTTATISTPRSCG